MGSYLFCPGKNVSLFLCMWLVIRLLVLYLYVELSAFHQSIIQPKKMFCICRKSKMSRECDVCRFWNEQVASSASVSLACMKLDATCVMSKLPRLQVWFLHALCHLCNVQAVISASASLACMVLDADSTFQEFHRRSIEKDSLGREGGRDRSLCPACQENLGDNFMSCFWSLHARWLVGKGLGVNAEKEMS